MWKSVHSRAVFFSSSRIVSREIYAFVVWNLEIGTYITLKKETDRTKVLSRLFIINWIIPIKINVPKNIFFLTRSMSIALGY